MKTKKTPPPIRGATYSENLTFIISYYNNSYIKKLRNPWKLQIKH